MASWVGYIIFKYRLLLAEMHRISLGSAENFKISCLFCYLFVLRQSASSVKQYTSIFKKKKKV